MPNDNIVEFARKPANYIIMYIEGMTDPTTFKSEPGKNEISIGFTEDYAICFVYEGEEVRALIPTLQLKMIKYE